MELSLKQAIEKAIEIEEEVIRFYQDKMLKAVYPGSRRLLEYLVEQKKGHKSFYEDYLSKSEELGGYCSMPVEFMDYKISDNLVEQNINENSRIQEILIFAAKQEQRIHEYYMALSEEYKDSEIGYIWECFARESLIHKEFFEKEYDENILTEA